ncbi:5-oxoprolinase subunit PxpB [Salicibibacter kimchii]|uniref:Allophanate hydrolase subunit 1 n=1 Tax=Salicibibacter kimchii TaxID=2099786 RepID=A0A345BZF0_9BACI|nr:5-oxoprolinase subunit PxpB [Salicibibacter kimchii]AXF56331.1 allophanate hydrolase subunit 1 [Salicibibacter kimchii]
MSTLFENAELYVLSETAINIVFGTKIDPKIHRHTKKMMNVLEDAPFEGYLECVPSYVGLTVFYDPVTVFHTMEKNDSPSTYVMEQLREKAREIGDATEDEDEGDVVTIPVCYEDSFGPDLSHVAEENNLSKEEVIHIHTSGEYLVYMIGFAPGFSFLGGMSKKIATPRRSEPRTKIPAGAVGIAGVQTGVYPLETPGGWQLIGQTPLKMFDSNREQPSLLKSGDTVYFKAITRAEFESYEEGDR